MNTTQNSKNCIYKIPCECGKFYIGESSRPLDTRINEHQNYIKNKQFEKSQICKHAWDYGHRIQFQNTSILHKEENNSRRKIKESALILLNENDCVANTSVEICRSWLPIIKDEISKTNLRLQYPVSG